MKQNLSITVIATLMANAAFGQVAYDSASDTAYDNGWQAGDNGGFGWQPWLLATGGHLVGDSNTNGAGGGPGINTSGPNTTGRSFGAGSGLDTGLRYLVNPMTIGSTMTVDIDPSFATSTSQLAFVISDTAFNPLYLSFNQGLGIQSNDNFGNLRTISLAQSDGGYRYSVTYNSSNTYAATLTALNGGSTASWSGPMMAAPGSVNFFFYRDTNVAADRQFINSMTVSGVPEPASMAALGLGIACIAARRRKRK